MIGAGLYADDALGDRAVISNLQRVTRDADPHLSLGAVSTTGIGESLLRYSAAFRIVSAMGQGQSPNEVSRDGETNTSLSND